MWVHILAVGSCPLPVRLSVMLEILRSGNSERDTDNLVILKISWMRSKWTDFSAEGRALTACESTDDKSQRKWWRGTQVPIVKMMEVMRIYGLCVHLNLNVLICEFFLTHWSGAIIMHILLQKIFKHVESFCFLSFNLIIIVFCLWKVLLVI